MAKTKSPNRVHLLIHANPAGKDLARLGFVDPDEYLAYIRSHLNAEFKLTFTRELFDTFEDESAGGRNDDTTRIRDLNQALKDPATAAIVALSGGGYLSRILPHLNFAPLRERKPPLLLTGFSEITSLVNLVAAYPCGRGLYWLCPNYLVWKLNPAEHARAAFAEFWRVLPKLIAGEALDGRYLPHGRLEGAVAAGTPRSGAIRVVGGCLSVLATLVGGKLFARVPLKDRWLLIEDVNEAVYRIDRYLAALKIAGWFDQIAGVVVGDFHQRETPDQSAAVIELLKYHLPPQRKLPVLTTSSLGHVWPMSPLPLNSFLKLEVVGRKFTLSGP